MLASVLGPLSPASGRKKETGGGGRRRCGLVRKDLYHIRAVCSLDWVGPLRIFKISTAQIFVGSIQDRFLEGIHI